MAGAGAPFSIRGYAVRARAGAVEEGSRCWPFGGEAGALPPMEVRRFRWWADEAVLAAEQEEGEAEEERRMAAKRRKRSIVELFATVPRVAGGEGLGRGKRVKRKLEKGELVLGVKTKKKGFKKEVSIEIGVRKKEKSRKVKVNSLSISQLFQDAVQKRKLKKSLGKKKINKEVSALLNKKSLNGNKKSVLDNQKAIRNSCHVQSILKKHLKIGMCAFLENTDLRCPSKSSRKSKHVTFSDEDDIFGLTASQPEDNTKQSQLLQTSQQPSQDEKSQVVDNQHNIDEQQLVCQRVDAISGTVEEDTSSASEMVVSTGVCRTVPLTKSNDRTILGNSVDLNHSIEMPNRGNCLNSISSVVLSGQVLSQNFADVDLHLKEGLCLDVGCQAEVNHHMIPQGSSVPVSLAVETRSDVMRNPLSQPSRSHFVASLSEAYDRNRRTLLQERLDANCHSTEVHPRLLRSGKDMVSSISSSTGSNKSTDAQTTDCASACQNMYFSDDYVGLPLNSHGEFVKVQPGGTLHPNGVFKRQCLGEDSLHPSVFPAFFTPKTCMGYANLRINHQALPLTPTMPTAYGMNFRQSPNSERIEDCNYAIPNDYPCSNQQELSVECFCSGCIGQYKQSQKSLEMQSCLPRQNYEQNIQPAAETTMRLMGKTVSLGTSSKQCRGLDNMSSCSSKQVRAEDHCFEGTCTKASPQFCHGGMVDPPSTFRISNGGRQPYEYPSCFSSVPAAELRSGLDINSFSTNSHSQQPQLAVPNKLFVQPVRWYNEVELGHQRPAVANQVQNTAKHVQLGSVHCRHTRVATMSSYDPKDSFKNFVETRPGPSQFSYFPQQFSNVAHRTPVSSFLSGYSVENTSGLTTQTRFTSLRPLPPSMISSHVYSSEDAQSHGSTPAFYPSIPQPDPTIKFNAPGDTIFKDKRSMKQAAIGSNLGSLEQINRSCKRSAEKDCVLLTLPKKPCVAVGKDLNLSPLPEEGLEFCVSTPEVQPQVCLSEEPEVDLRLVNNDTRTTWSDFVNRVRARPVKLKSGAKHILQPSTSASMDQEDSWPVHSIIQFGVKNDACSVSTSVKRDAEIY